MTTRLTRTRSLLPTLTSALQSFQSSSSKFQIVRTVNPSSTSSPPPANPKTLYILDSSFNPPSIAHLALATSALTSASSQHHARPHRLLLLFSTHNADKAPSAASFPQRLVLMTLLAEDLLSTFQPPSSSAPAHEDADALAVDIGLTTAPYYTDKSAAIAASDVYPSHPVHIHLVGFDTLTRFFNAKYYPDFDPPLSAVAPFFDAGHRLRVTLRPDDEFGSAAQQREYLAKIARGEREGEGARREWAELIEMVDADESVGVSSTRVRRAAKKGDWEEVERLCTRGVAEWVREEKLYEGDDRGSKMA
ncbi:hypothetical protein BJ546DRAFT_1027821 [Cryomyces antarcticus]